MADWLKTCAQIPDNTEVDLCGVQYGYSSKSQIQLERKENMNAAEWRRPISETHWPWVSR